jgi:hypothetical protein
MRGRTIFAAVAAAAATTSATAWTPFPDSTLNVTEVVWQPEHTGIYLGSPSVLRIGPSTILAAHDKFGGGTKEGAGTAYVFASNDDGQTWAPAGQASPMYWATLFQRPGDSAVYLMGAGGDGSAPPTQATISRSMDGGKTWATAVAVTHSNVSYSTGCTPVLIHAGRIWRAYEHNVGPGWATGYSALVLSAPLNATDLLDPSVWTSSGELNFQSVAGKVPAAWSSPQIVSNFGWLEGNAVEPVGGDSDPGVHIFLRVNSQPAANKGALLYVPAPAAMPTFVGWVDPFPGGMSKFAIRRDNVSGLYVTLSNWVSDSSVTFPPMCGPASMPSAAVPCCGFMEACYTTFPNCLWCHADARNNLTLSVSADLQTWRVISVVLTDDTGVPTYTSLLGTGFQYVDYHFDGADGGDIVYAARAGYRGSNNYHNANRQLFGRVTDWRGQSARVAPDLVEEARSRKEHRDSRKGL